MLCNLAADNRSLAQSMRELHELCDEINDVATASLVENYLDDAEGRIWFLAETTYSEEVPAA